MKYDLSNPKKAAEAIQYLVELTAGGKWAEVKKYSPKRTISQNNYLHLLLGAFGAHFGYDLEEAKTIYKQLNSPIYVYEREVRGKKHMFMRSSADISKEDMAKSIDVLREWSDKAGYPLPLATDQEWLHQIEGEIERASFYL